MTDAFAMDIEKLAEASRSLARERLKDFLPEGCFWEPREDSTRYRMNEAAALVGRTPESIRDAEKRKLVNAPDINPRTGRRIGYTLKQINHLRRHFHTRPYRDAADPPMVLNIWSFVAGVGKSCICAHLAHGLAIRGYRVLVVDTDPNATVTSLLGLIPDLGFDYTNTFAPLFRGESDGFLSSVRRTCVDQLDLIPASLCVSDLGAGIASSTPMDRAALERIRLAVQKAAEPYDIVLIDSASVQTAMTLPMLYAANALLVPQSPPEFEHGSRYESLCMLWGRYESMVDMGGDISIDWIRGVINEHSEEHSNVAVHQRPERDEAMRMLQSTLRFNSEITKALEEQSTVFAHVPTRRSKQNWRGALNNLNAFIAEMEMLIQSTWPKRFAELRHKGYC